MYSYEEIGELQLILDNLKSEEGKDYYKEKTQTLFKIMRVKFFEYSNYRESTVFMNLQNFQLKFM